MSEMSEKSEESELFEKSEKKFDNAVAADPTYLSQQQSEIKVRIMDPELLVQGSCPSNYDEDIIIRTMDSKPQV